MNFTNNPNQLGFNIGGALQGIGQSLGMGSEANKGYDAAQGGFNRLYSMLNQNRQMGGHDMDIRKANQIGKEYLGRMGSFGINPPSTALPNLGNQV